MNKKNQTTSKNGTVKIIQITDTHLFANDESHIFGVKSNLKFKEVVAKILSEDIDDTDMIFLTGDISQDETAESYQKVVNTLDVLNIPIYWVPGNHDNSIHIESVFKHAKNFIQTPHLFLQDWNFIFLNTKLEGTPEGFLSDTALQMLRNQVSQDEKKLVVVMHHHLTPVNTPLIDNYILKNRTEFWDIVTATNVKLIICGHVHGDYQFEHNNIMIESSPATCLQWQKGTKDLKIDNKIGYKIYYFDALSYQAVAKLW